MAMEDHCMRQVSPSLSASLLFILIFFFFFFPSRLTEMPEEILTPVTDTLDGGHTLDGMTA